MEVTLWLTVNIRSGCTLTTDKTVGSPRAQALALPCGGHVPGFLGMWGIARDWVSSRFSQFNSAVACMNQHATAYFGEGSMYSPATASAKTMVRAVLHWDQGY